MGFPAGMQLATIAFGIPLTATGKEVVTNVTVKPTARLIWAATGQPLPEFEDSFTAEAGQLGQFQVPFVDQPGFIDSLGNAVTDFAYQVTASWQFGNARPITWTKNLKPLLGQTGPIDLDLVPDGPVSIPVTAPTASVLGFNGRTGFITLQDSDLPSRLSDAQLSATYAPVSGSTNYASTASVAAKLDSATAATTYAPKAGLTTAAATGVYVQRYPKAKSTAISRFHAGLANRRTAPCDWVAIGDSITEGEGATARDFRWVTRARDLIRAQYPTAGVEGGANYRTANPIVSSYPKDPPGAYTSDTRFGLGKRSVQLAAGTPLVFTEYGTSFKIGWFRDSGTGSFSYSVDGAAAVTVPTNGTHTGEVLTTISGLTPGQHTISISLVSGYVLINGLYVYYGDEAAGIRVYESGHFGWKASDFINTPSGGTATDWLTSVNLIQPHLVTIALGANDAVSQSAATYKTNMQTLITNVKAAITTAPSIVLIGYGARSDTLTEPWANYIQAMKDIATADTTVDCLDLTTVLPAVSGSPAGWYRDTVHPSNKGHNEIAKAVVEFITP